MGHPMHGSGQGGRRTDDYYKRRAAKGQGINRVENLSLQAKVLQEKFNSIPASSPLEKQNVLNQIRALNQKIRDLMSRR